MNTGQSKYQTKSQKLKKTYVDKIVLFLSNKYKGFFKDKNYTQKQLVSDVSKALSEKEMKTFNLGTALTKYEKMILEKISKIESKKPIGLEMDHINQLLPKKKVETKAEDNKKVTVDNPVIEEVKKTTVDNNNSKNVQQVQTKPKTINEVPYSTDMLERQRQKQNDKWAKLANEDHERYLQEEKEKRKIKEEQMRIQKEYLEQQIREKELQRKKLKEEEQNFLLENNNRNPFINTKAEGIKKPTNESHNIPPAQNKKQNEYSNKRLADELEKQKYNKELKDEMNKFEENEKRKKKELREKYIQLQKENEESARLRQIALKNKNKENKEIKENPFCGYENTKPKQQIVIDDHSAYNKKQILVKEYEAKKLQREIEEKAKKEHDEEEMKKIKKQKMIEEFRNGLDQQIIAKKALNQQNKEGKKNDRAQIEKINNEINQERDNQVQNKKDKINQYKKLLDDQVQKNQNKE